MPIEPRPGTTPGFLFPPSEMTMSSNREPLPADTVEHQPRQALGWLRADLVLYTRMVDSATAATREVIRQRLVHWQQDADLAPVRDRDALDRLPDLEGHSWRRLWEDVASLLARASSNH
jgi:hypothetical protein